MATRLNAREEKIATLRSIMNVISILDQEHPRQSGRPLEVDLRALLLAPAFAADEIWGREPLLNAATNREVHI